MNVFIRFIRTHSRWPPAYVLTPAEFLATGLPTPLPYAVGWELYFRSTDLSENEGMSRILSRGYNTYVAAGVRRSKVLPPPPRKQLPWNLSKAPDLIIGLHSHMLIFVLSFPMLFATRETNYVVARSLTAGTSSALWSTSVDTNACKENISLT
jgi:hypothetical protein